MAMITCLNIDTISIILSNDNISIEDVFNFTFTCKSLYAIIDEDNMFWKKKLFQRWPFLKKIYDAFEGHVNFKDQVKASMKCRTKLWNYLSYMSQKHCYRNTLLIDDMSLLYDPENDAHNMNFYFFKAELINLLTLSSKNSDCDLTQKYYAKQILLCMQQYFLKYKWEKFSSSYKEQIVEEAAIVMAKWFQLQKHVFDSNIKTSLDNITETILQHILKKYPKHPISTTPIEQFSSYDINNNQWYIEEGEQIMNSIEEILYETYSIQEAEISSKLEYFFIDYVLENKIGNISSIAIIFLSVARRLGMHCEFLQDDGNQFFLIWKPKCFRREKKFIYTNIMENMLAWKRRDFMNPRYYKKNFPPRDSATCCLCNPAYRYFNLVVSEMTKISKLSFKLEVIDTYFNTFDILKSLLEIERMANIQHIKFHLIHENGISILIDMIKECNIRREEASVLLCQTPKQRTEKIKFSVGQVVKFKNEYHNQHIGVIIEWDDPLNLSSKHWSEILSEHWYDIVPQDIINGLQPFYTILSENDTKYIIQENIMKIIPPEEFNNEEIGRYFCRLEKNYYVPNQMLATHYPYDLTVSPKNTSPSRKISTSPMNEM